MNPAAEHLTGQTCGRCGHPHEAHRRNPSCRLCRCSADPVCSCGLLTSYHYHANEGSAK